MTLGTMRAMIRKRLGETVAAFWTDSQLNDWIKDASDEISFKTKAIKTNGKFVSSIGVTDYTASSHLTDITSVYEAYYDTGVTSGATHTETWKKLIMLQEGRTELNNRFPGWRNTENDVPHYYYYDNEEDLFFLWPPPKTDVAGADRVHAYYTKKHPTYANDNAESSLPLPLHLAVVDWVTSLGYESRGYGDKANDAMSKVNGRMREYLTEKKRQKEDEEIITRPYNYGRKY